MHAMVAVCSVGHRVLLGRAVMLAGAAHSLGVWHVSDEALEGYMYGVWLSLRDVAGKKGVWLSFRQGRGRGVCVGGGAYLACP